MTIRNPVLRGFNPDPSICRVGVDYYIATSTFEWYPGVALHHSRDLANWRQIGHVLTDPAHLNLAGVVDSAGIWAPSLSYHDGRFYLIYTIVRTRVGNYKDVHNYLVTAKDIHGPWSEPIYLNSSGFDPSLFHDDDGRKWLLNIQWDYRKDRPRFAGILLQEYDPCLRRLVGEARTILTKDVLIEGPNLYKKYGYYYLMLAEGGTGWNHGISMARSRSIEGPYEVDTQPVLTSRDDESLVLQKAGHGELVQTPLGDWYMAHLCSRPVGKDRRCILGRETALQECVWTDDGWLRLAGGGHHPFVEIRRPLLEGKAALESSVPSRYPAAAVRDDFDLPSLSPQWSSLRVPVDDTWLSLSERPGWLRLRGRESLCSLFEQSLLARRLIDVHCVAETVVEFAPAHFTQSAGLICYYDTKTHYYLRVMHHEERGKVLGIVLSDDGVYDELTDHEIVIGDWGHCYLRAVFAHETLQFYASPNGREWQAVGPALDATKLSDDYGQGLHFTGAHVGVCAQDLNGTRTPADFDYFELRSL